MEQKLCTSCKYIWLFLSQQDEVVYASTVWQSRKGVQKCNSRYPSMLNGLHSLCQRLLVIYQMPVPYSPSPLATVLQVAGQYFNNSAEHKIE